MGEVGDAELVYSDQRVVDEEGRVLSPSYWTERRNNYDNLASLLLANTVTGAASLFRRDLLDRALPFPDTPGTQYHDHWLALVALASGRIRFIDRPLYDYIQHGSAALGHAAASVPAAPGVREIVRRLRRRRGLPQIVASRTGYFFDLIRLQLVCAGASDALRATNAPSGPAGAAAPAASRALTAIPRLARSSSGTTSRGAQRHPGGGAADDPSGGLALRDAGRCRRADRVRAHRPPTTRACLLRARREAPSPRSISPSCGSSR